VNGLECSSREREYPAFCKLMTGDVNAAVEGALEAGATEIVVNDSHGGGRNLLLDLLHPKAILSRGQPLPSMIAPLDASFDAAMAVGYHARRGTACAILDHSFSGRYNAIRLNGREFGEFGMAAAYAGAFGVPMVFASGDDKLVAEAQEFVPGIRTATVKFATGRTSARCLSAERTGDLIRQGAREGLARENWTQPFVLEPPIVVEVEYADCAAADTAAYVPGVERIDGRTIRRAFDAFAEASCFISVLCRLPS